MKKPIYLPSLLTLFISLLILSGCGVKPKHVDPPEGAEHSPFPRVYPALETDPQSFDTKEETVH